MLNVLKSCVNEIKLYIIMWSVFVLSVVTLGVFMLDDIKLRIVMRTNFVLNVLILRDSKCVFVLSVVTLTPYVECHCSECRFA